MTSGGDRGLSGEQLKAGSLRDPLPIAALAFAAFGSLYMVVNAVTLIDQRRALGQPIAKWQAWVLEGTSFAAWLALLPFILMLAARLVSRPLPLTTLGHAAGCIVVSLVHTALMVGLRIAAYALAGDHYAPTERWSDRLFFEARKDLITYISILAVFLVARQLVAPRMAIRPSPTLEAPLIEVRDGSRVVMLQPDEIDWVSAAGNYVELHGLFGSELARRKLADMEAELAHHGFVRVHRSRIVRRTAIASTETKQSGDFEITLRSGAVINGSRRFRQNLLQDAFRG
ncbi:response regulator of the lytR/algR family [Novosphingobium sp. MD-1]|nr:response regulator of the lytR/algR family [Novosphingobium sp. MD-1]